MKKNHILSWALIVIGGMAATAATGSGTLRVHSDNPRYFTDDSGQAIYLTGSHTWNNAVDMGPVDPPEPLDFPAHIQWLKGQGHNFIRLWTWELPRWDTARNKNKPPYNHHIAPLCYLRTGPGLALDGKPKFDLTKVNPAYLERLRARVGFAAENGIYVSVMLFEGWGNQFLSNSYEISPFNSFNNVNGIDGDPDEDGVALEVHQLAVPEITKIQKAYVKRVLEELNGFDNLLYEIGNEIHASSTNWQYDMIRFIKDYEKGLPKQHPVGMTYQHKLGVNKTLFDSPADWISPNDVVLYRDNPPPADGSKIIIADTDHFWGIGGNATWVWKSFLRGLNPVFMDTVDDSVLSRDSEKVDAESIRKAMGATLEWSRRINLTTMEPRGELTNSNYCLADPGREYLVFAPSGMGKVILELPSGNYRFLWYDTVSASETVVKNFKHPGGIRKIQIPFSGDSLLHVLRQSSL